MPALVPAVLTMLAVASAPPTVSPADAAKHVGQEVVVLGTVDQMATTVNLTTHINFGGRYPDHVFTATILRANQPLFTGVREYEGKLVEVQGVVRLYRNKPEIMLTDPKQIRLAPAGAPAAATPAALTVEVSDPRFDAKGADFGEWIVQFKKSVLERWRRPDAAASTAGGSTELDFVVERNGSLSAFRQLRSSGTRALDRAAEDALTGSRFLPLPEAYPGANVIMKVTVVCGAGAAAPAK